MQTTPILLNSKMHNKALYYSALLCILLFNSAVQCLKVYYNEMTFGWTGHKSKSLSVVLIFQILEIQVFR